MTDKRDLLTVLLTRREVVAMTDQEIRRYLRYLRWNWGQVYEIVRPSQLPGTWKATAKWGNKDILEARSPDELLDLIAHHYAPSTEGYTEMLMDKLGKKYS